jgi:hypothetical protein
MLVYNWVLNLLAVRGAPWVCFVPICSRVTQSGRIAPADAVFHYKSTHAPPIVNVSVGSPKHRGFQPRDRGSKRVHDGEPNPPPVNAAAGCAVAESYVSLL